MMYLIFWGVIFVISLIAEIASMQLISIWFTVGSVGAFIAAMMSFWICCSSAIAECITW